MATGGPSGTSAGRVTCCCQMHRKPSRVETDYQWYEIDGAWNYEPITRRGIPRTPSPEVADAILHEVRTMSQSFGAEVKVDDGTGIVTQA